MQQHSIEDLKQRRFRNGPLTFSALEQGTGIPVLLLHGFPDHAPTFRFQLPALAAAGYHAIAPMMRGYEASSQPVDNDYRISSLAQDVLAFIDQSGQERVHLVGHDWGAVVSYLVAAIAPDKLISLTTLAIPPPGRLVRKGIRALPSQVLKSWYMLFFQIPYLSDYALSYRDWALLEWLWRRWSPGWDMPEAELQALKTTFQQPGVKRAALNYYRSMLSPRSTRDTQATLKHMNKKIQVPTLAVTGEQDGCMDTRLHDILIKPAYFPAGMDLVRIKGAGHFLHQERANNFNQRLLEHLKASERQLQAEG